ncbi:MAG TPA: cytochrome c peroxidase [Candidatus Binatia bacterium]|nr:cytochrome c peroxidase [Candidatus Binatia bacterium]
MRRTLYALGIAIAATAFAAWLGAPQAADPPPVPPALPLGVSRVMYEISVPADRWPTQEKVALGEKLFNDKRLSVDGTVSCSTCHDPKRGFVDHKPQSEGVKQQKGQRNSPTVLNAMFNATQFWDGRAPSLEEQAKLPVLNPIEMAQKSPEDVVAKLQGIAEYAERFKAVFGRDVTYDDMAAAIAAFERTQYAGDAPFDHFIAGETKAIGDSARRGWALFNGKGRCNDCHAVSTANPLFSDQKFHNIGIAAHKVDFIDRARKAAAVVRSGDVKQVDELAIQTEFSELGRFLVTKRLNDIGAFKTPTLRNIAATAPYMHDGSLATLWDVMDHYNKGGVANPYLDGGMQRLGLSEAEIDDMVAFLETLTTPRFAAFAKEEMGKQRARKGTRPERDTETAMGRKGHLGDLAPNPDLKNPAEIGIVGVVTKGAKP